MIDKNEVPNDFGMEIIPQANAPCFAGILPP